jgi:hypothetical protein
VAYEEFFSSMRLDKNIIIPNTRGRFVPLLKIELEVYLQDNRYIIETLELNHPADPSLQMSQSKNSLPIYLSFGRMNGY